MYARRMRIPASASPPSALQSLDERLLRAARTWGHGDPLLERAVARFSRLGEHGAVWLALGAGYAQQPAVPPNPQLAKDPGPFLPGSDFPEDKVPKAVAGPAPHLPDGRPDFGGNGAWYPGVPSWWDCHR